MTQQFPSNAKGRHITGSNVPEQVHFQTPMSFSLQPASAAATTSSNTIGTTTMDLPSMSPLTIGGMEGLTDQQAAEVAELLTPFLSPTATPVVLGMASRTFSPLTSPALASQQYGQFQQQMQQQQQQQQSAADAMTMTMPPPSPSTTADQIMMRQQQQQMQYMDNTARRGRRGTNASSSHHPYRQTTTQQQQQQQQQTRWTNEDYLLDSLAASLQNTPSLQFTASTASVSTNVFAGLNLPDSIFAASTSSDTSSQLLSEPAAAAAPQASNQLLHQLNDTTSSSSQAATATPASLLNLPSSAHHLPHTSNGEIVTPSQDAYPPPLPAPLQQHQSIVATATTAAAQSHALMSNFLIHSAPMQAEFLHLPAPPPLVIDKPSTEESSGKRQRGGRRKSMTATTGDKVVVKAKRNEATRRRSRQALLSPHTTPLVPSTLKAIASPALAPLPPYNNSKEGRGPTTPSTTTSTPQMRPRSSVVAATSTTNIVGLEADVVTRLATKSNYQNIIEGKSELLGLNYRTEFKSGLEKRRTNHKQAEQKRRDSLKTCFQDLHSRLPDVDAKLVSKIYLLNKANGYIDALKKANERIAEAARQQGIDVDAIMAEAFDEISNDSCAEDQMDLEEEL
ncbi:hypothetical protein EV175_000150 [Coemansia sp. RSA 1933]|nr:hypothetical protein EV175_000150 [Coemansia sp. RSA 1933]